MVSAISLCYVDGLCIDKLPTYTELSVERRYMKVEEKIFEEKDYNQNISKEKEPEAAVSETLEKNSESMEHEIPERANYAEELFDIIRSDEPSLSKLDKLDDYHDNDIAAALEYLESEERRRLYSLLGVDKVSDIFSYIDDPAEYIEELEPEVAARISAHLRREARTHDSSRLLASQELLVNLSRRTVHFKGTEIEFSKREFDILELLLTHAGQVFDRERIYEVVWGLDACGDSDVVKEHIRKIRQKLQNVAGEDYIETVWGVGYRWKQ